MLNTFTNTKELSQYIEGLTPRHSWMSKLYFQDNVGRCYYLEALAKRIGELPCNSVYDYKWRHRAVVRLRYFERGPNGLLYGRVDELRRLEIEAKSHMQDPGWVEGRLQYNLEVALWAGERDPWRSFQMFNKVADGIDSLGDTGVGMAWMQGRRSRMEDSSLSFDFVVAGHLVQFYGIFDGHSGDTASTYLKDELEIALQKQLKDLSVEGIRTTLHDLLPCMHNQYRMLGGSCALIALVINGNVWLANLGDSRAVLQGVGQVTEDAEPWRIRYKRKIEARGGRVGRDGRINGGVNIARTFGDKHYPISHAPKITHFPLIPGKYLLLGCDGFFDAACTVEAMKALDALEEMGLTPMQMATKLVSDAYFSGSGDNISVTVVKL